MPDDREKNTRSILRQMGRLERAKKRFLNDRLRERDMKILTFMAILHLNRAPGISQDELSAELLTDKANCARLCREMEEQGHIRREHSTEDRRQNRLFLTEQGASEVPELRKLLDDCREIICSDIEPDELGKILKTLTHMADNLEGK